MYLSHLCFSCIADQAYWVGEAFTQNYTKKSWLVLCCGSSRSGLFFLVLYQNKKALKMSEEQYKHH